MNPKIDPNQTVSPMFNEDGIIIGGLTIRAHFALTLMAAHISSDEESFHCDIGTHALYGVKAADALIAELNKGAS